MNIKPTTLIINLFFCLFVISGYSQNTKSILLNRVVYPIYSMDKQKNHFEDSMLTKSSDKSKYLAGDYSDGNIEFTVAIDNGEYGRTSVTFYVASYKTDSIYVGGGIGINQATLVDKVPLTLMVGKKEFSARVDIDNKSVLITEISKYIEPDVELISNNNLPDVSFSLLYGGKSSFQAYEHKESYIYLEFWGIWCSHCYKAMDDLKELNGKYCNNVKLISIAFNEPASSNQTIDTNNIKNVVELHKIGWLQGVADKYIRRLFYLNSAPYGRQFLELKRRVAFRQAELHEYRKSLAVPPKHQFNFYTISMEVKEKIFEHTIGPIKQYKKNFDESLVEENGMFYSLVLLAWLWANDYIIVSKIEQGERRSWWAEVDPRISLDYNRYDGLNSLGIGINLYSTWYYYKLEKVCYLLKEQE
jgi:thiol-disulfide isomerase/thioredoxin